MAAKDSEPLSWPLQSSFDSDSTIAHTKRNKIEAREKQPPTLKASMKTCLTFCKFISSIILLKVVSAPKQCGT